MKLLDAREDPIEADAIGVEHRAAAPCREAVAVDVDGIDVRGPQRQSFVEHARALVDQRVNRALDNRVVGEGPLCDAGLAGA
jgi:hypothetical protein